MSSWRNRMMALVVTALVGGLVGLWLWLPSAILSRAQSAAALRGLILDIDDVSLSPASVELEGVRVRGARGTALDASVERVRVGLSAPSLLFGVRAAVRELEIESPHAVVDVSGEDFADTLASLRGAAERRDQRIRRGEVAAGDADSDEAEAGVTWPPVTLSGGEFELRDGEGTVAQVTGVEVRSQAEGGWQTDVERLVVGARPGEVVTLEDLHAEGTLSGRRPQLESLQVGGGLLEWVEDDSESSARGRTLERVRQVRARLRAGSPGAGARADAAAAGAAEPTAPPLLAPELRVDVSGLRVLSAGPSGAPLTVLRDLDVLLEGAGEGRFRARGSGTSDGEGRLKWDLYVEPKQARVEGSVSLHALPLSLVAPLLPPIPWHGLDRSRIDARLTLRGEGLERIAAQGELRLADVTIAARGIAHDPVGPFGVVLRGKGAWIPAQRRFELRDGSAESGGVRVALEGAMEWAPDHYLFDLTGQLGETQCADVLAAMPPGLLEELSQVRFAGTFEAGVELLVDSRALDETVVDFAIDDRCRFLTVPPLLAAERFRRPFMHRALEPDGTVFEMETGPGTPAWTSIEQISPFMIQAVIAHEDGAFFRHNGFAERQIAVALSRNLKAGAYKFGASTITMQLVKNVFLHREKLLARKVQEAMITWWLEQRWSKKDILELYLNVIEYGPSVYGLRNAAWYYFGITPEDLSPGQSAFLAMILPNPKRFHAQISDGTLPDRLRQRIERFLKHMHARERIDDEALAFGLEELANFRFYREGQPAQKRDIRGSAKPPPYAEEGDGFDRESFDAWDLDPTDVGVLP